MSDPATCTSENVTFEVVQVPSRRHAGLTPAIKMQCHDCVKYGFTSVETFDEARFAGAWNDHHARQMAARVAEASKSL